MPLRVWSEFLGFDELRSPAVLGLLRRFQVNLCLQVTAFEGLASVLRDYDDTSIWLLLPKEQGYWPSERNAELFASRVDELLRWADREQVRMPWLAVDLERPLWQAKLLDGAHGAGKLLAQTRVAAANLNRRRFARAQAIYRNMAEGAHHSGLKLLCAAHEYILDDLVAGASLMQDLHEAPVLAVPWDAISVMLYTSLGCDRRWLYEVARDLRLRLADSVAGASIGLTGVGVLGSEPHYVGPAELAPDVAALKAAGVDDLAIYNLEGILDSGNPEAWFEMVLNTPPAVPPPTAASRRRQLRVKLRRLALGAFG
jgi:hypothetical protein